MPVDLAHLHPRLRQIVHDLGGPLVCASAARSTDEQRYLYENRNRPGFNPANPPGQSNHEFDPDAPWPNVTAEANEASSLPGGCWAIAVDFVSPYPHDHPELCFPIAGEPWHGQLRPACQAKRFAGMWRALPPGLVEPLPPPPDPLQLVGRTALVFAGETLA